MKQLSIGDKIRHDFSGNTGIIIDYRDNPQGYKYQVRWDKMGLRVDWYSRAVLQVAPTPDIRILGMSAENAKKAMTTPEDTELEILVDNLRYIFALPPDEYNFTKRDEAMNLITLHTQKARIDTAKYIGGMFPAEEPEIIASNRGEDYDNAWIKGQMALANMLYEEIEVYIAHLTNPTEAGEK